MNAARFEKHAHYSLEFAFANRRPFHVALDAWYTAAPVERFAVYCRLLGYDPVNVVPLGRRHA